MTATTVPCRFCLSLIEPAAKKCRYCHEFLDSPAGRSVSSPNWLEVYRATADAIARLAIPLTIFLVLLVLRDDLRPLLERTASAKFGDTEILFDVPEVFDRTLAIHPLSLSYLLDAVKLRPGSIWNYNLIPEHHREYIRALQEKGLATVSVSDSKETDPQRRNIFGERELRIIPSQKGYEFLASIGLGDITTNTRSPAVAAPSSRTN